MKKKTSVSIVILAAAVFLIITAFAVFQGPGGGGEKIVLPSQTSQSEAEGDPGGSPEPTDDKPAGGITAGNVLQVVSVMNRSENYNQRFLISIDSGYTETAEVWYLDGLIRAVFDRSSETKNVIISGDDIYIWYEGDEDFYTGPLGKDFTADDELNIPTYEDLLSSDDFVIKDARYSSLEDLGEYCIYVEAGKDDGVTERFWISCSTGLLVRYEAETGGRIVYSMLQTFIESPVTSDEAFKAAFTLPGGRTIA